MHRCRRGVGGAPDLGEQLLQVDALKCHVLIAPSETLDGHPLAVYVNARRLAAVAAVHKAAAVVHVGETAHADPPGSR